MELSQLYGSTVRECMGNIQQKIGNEEVLAYLEKQHQELVDSSEDELCNRLRLAMAFHWEMRRLNLAYIQEGVEIYFQILRFCLRRESQCRRVFDDYELSVLLYELGSLFNRSRVLLRQWDAEAEINAILFEAKDGELKLRDIYKNLPYVAIFADKWFPPRYAVPVYQKALKQMKEYPKSKEEDDKQKEKVANAVKRAERNSNSWIGGILFVMLLVLGLSKLWSGIPYLGGFLSFLILVGIIILLFITMMKLAWGSVHLFKRFVPRITACMVVGYIPKYASHQSTRN